MMSRGPYPMLLMLAMSLPGAAKALGLGDIRVDSALNEPLSAQIDIVGATRDELAALTAKVANREIFQRYGADRPSFLSSATFKVGLDAQGRPVLNIRSSESFTDPVINFLVDLRWGNGELVREYSLLLDPAVYSSDTRFAAVTPAATTTGTATPAGPATAGRPGTASATSLPQHARGMRVAASDEPITTHHRVAAHDTLRGIVRRAGARTETEAQRMMLAVFRANPSAFEGNINRLHSGAELTMPSAEDIATIDAAQARREVRAQMTAWRLDGRPAVARRGATPAATASASAEEASGTNSANDALQARVHSLEQALDDVHRQLASENAKIQDLKQLAAPAAARVEPAVAAAAAPAPASTADVAPVAAAHAVVAPALPVAAVALNAPHPAVVPTAPVTPMAPHAALAPAAAAATITPVAPVQVEVVRAANPPAPQLAAVLPTTTAPKVRAAIIAPVAGALALLLAGVAYVRRRRQAQAPAAPIVRLDETASFADDRPDLPAVQPSVTAAPQPSIPAPAAISAVLPPVQAKSAAPAKPAAEDMTVDTDALERSYLDMGVDALGIDTIVFNAPLDPVSVAATLGDTADTAAHDMNLRDTAKLDTASLATVAIDASELETALGEADLNTAILDPKALTADPVGVAILDYNLLDLDATAAQHVQMPSELNDHPVVAERRTNIVDVLKAAIERDPQRRDLRMKLLETYYSTAATNQRAFLDVVRKLSREREFLSQEDWKRVVRMGREIAADDILFVEQPEDGDLANCA